RPTRGPPTPATPRRGRSGAGRPRGRPGPARLERSAGPTRSQFPAPGRLGQAALLRRFQLAGNRRPAEHFPVHRRSRLDLRQDLAKRRNGKILKICRGFCSTLSHWPLRSPAVNESQIFIEALKRPSPSERAAFLASAYGGDQQLRDGVEELLHLHAQEPDFLELAHSSFDPTEDEPAVGDPLAESIVERPGTLI